VSQDASKQRVGAVGYLNTLPLVWGMLHGEQREQVDLSFAIPAVCAQEVESGAVRIGLVPVAEVARQGLETVPGVGITCLGAVRSILLFSRVPWTSVRTLAADLSSRTSTQLARIILRERFGVEPTVAPYEPELDKMLAEADAALVIGDPALRLSPEQLPYQWLDLGSEWLALTKLPMVFALWAGKSPLDIPPLEEITRGSYAFGRTRIDEIVRSECASRQISKELGDVYLRQHIRYEVGAQERKGLAAFLELGRLPRRSYAEIL
jgi:chorismate dehydratase